MAITSRSDETAPEGIDARTLTEVVRRARGDEAAELLGWRSESIWEPRLTSTRGVYRITADVATVRESSPPRVVLKLLAPDPTGALAREAELYRSGALASLAGGLVAPACYQVAPQTDGTIAVWMEDLADACGPVWSIEQFARAAHHLGELAALDQGPLVALARAVPPRIYCLQHELRSENFARLRTLGDHPLVLRAYPPAVARAFEALDARREPILTALDRVPRLVCHGDAQKRNLFAHRDIDGRVRTAAIDWANLATAPVGLDVATLVHYALVYFDADIDQAIELDRQAYEGYARGLRAGGWRGDPLVVRFAYAAQISLGIGLLEVHPVLRLATDPSRHAWAEAFYGRPLGQILERRAAVAEFLIGLGEEARALAPCL